jgi:predicted  nucleic acid-binding Zn-ribbon protein
MNDIAQFSTLAALIIGGFGFFAFLFTRLEKRMDRLDDRMDRLADRMDRLADRLGSIEKGLPGEFERLRHDLAEEFRAQRAEVAAQVSAIANAINAARRQ